MKRRRLLEQRGEELVEFAIASVLFMTLLFLILQGGILIWRYNMLASYAQAGARWAAVRGSTSDPDTFFLEGTATGVQNYVQAFDPAITASIDTAPNTLGPGKTFTVTVTRPIPRIGFYNWSGTMTAQAQMQIAR